MNARALHNILDGFRDSFYLLRDDPYIRPDRDGFRQDAAHLRRDAERIASIAAGKTKIAMVNEQNNNRSR